MEMFFIVSSLAILAIAYVAVSLRDRNYLNVLTPTYAIFIPGNYLSDIYTLAVFGPTASPYAYFLNYLAYAAFLGMTAVGYLLAVPTFRLRLPSRRPYRGGRLIAYVFLALALALYWPVLSQFRADILNPRAIYEQTRTGFGANFFLSATLCYLALIEFLFQKTSRTEKIVFITVCIGLMWLHGSKGHVIGLLFILAIYYAYVAKRRVSLLGMTAVAGGLLFSVVLLFLVTNPGIVLTNGFENLVGYSSYTANSMTVIDSNIGPLSGRLTLEQQLYSRLPRALDPDKPRDYGEFYLAERFFPEDYERGSGAPAFGFGTLFADFGVLAPLILAFAGLINGVVMKSFANSLKRYQGPGEFILLLFAAGIPLIPFVNEFLIFETLGIAVAANLFHRFRLLGRPIRVGFRFRLPKLDERAAS